MSTTGSMCRHLSRSLPTQESDVVRSRFLARHGALSAQVPRNAHPVLARHEATMILPALAMAQTLEAAGYGRAQVREWLAAYFRYRFRTTRLVYSALGRLPFFFPLFRHLLRYSMRQRYPEAGWKRTWRADRPDLMAFDMESCHYRQILETQGHGWLLDLFCMVDDYLYGSMSPGLSWERTRTLACGSCACDFRFARVSPRQRKEAP